MEKTNQGSQTFCVNCGTPNEAGLLFCHNCGAKIPTPEFKTVQTSAAPQQYNAPVQAYQPQMAPPYVPQTRKSRKKIAIVAVVSIVAVVLLLIIAAVAINAGRNAASAFSPSPDISYVSATYSQATISGDLTVNIDVTNLGNAIGSSTITVYVYENSGTYSNSELITLAPSQTKTVPITVNTPFGTSISASMFHIYVDGEKVA